MNRNHVMLYALFITLVAALVGCGGGDPSNISTVTPSVGGSGSSAGAGGSSATGGSGGTQCTMSLGDVCFNEGATDPCNGLVCHCGHLSTNASTPCDAPDADVDAGVDAEVDAPDADVDVPDVVTPTEICGNGLDDDGNGAADCQDSACSAETECQEEVCNGADDNDNGQIDEGFECKLGTPSASCQTTCGSIGTMQCGNDCTWSNTCFPPIENCTNGIDDNCNGATDCNDTDCLSDPSCQCDAPVIGSPCGLAGEFSCDPTIRCGCSDFTWKSASSGDFTCIVNESCNGLDDNANNLVDEGFACVKGSSQNCITSCGSTGYQTCGATCELGACVPPQESCGNGVDDDCDGNTDCADSDCAGLLACQEEICDGADNNGNGLKDEGFECSAGSTGSCSTSCGSAGSYTCTNSCTKGACIAFENCYAQGDEDCDGKADCADSDCSALPVCQTTPDENCTNGVDDDGDGKADCADSDCSALPVCQTTGEICNNAIDDDGDSLMDGLDPDCNHDYGVCPQNGPVQGTQNCTTPVQEIVPDGMSIVQGIDAYSDVQQLMVGTNNWLEGKIYSRQGESWVNIPLPVTTKAVMGVKFVGSNLAYATAVTDTDSYLLRWNGTSVTVAAYVTNTEFFPLWGKTGNDIWIYGQRDLDSVSGSAMYHWNGSSLTVHELPAFYAPSAFQGRAMTGAGNHLYLVGSMYDPLDRNNPDKVFGAMIHFDGMSWAPIVVGTDVRSLDGINAADVCNVTAVGGNRVGGTAVGVSFSRSGATWNKTFSSEVNYSKGVVKTSLGKEILMGGIDGAPSTAMLGTTQNTSYSWSEDFSYLAPGSQLYYPGPLAKIPETNTILISGAGHHGAADPSGLGDYAFVFRTTCQ